VPLGPCRGGPCRIFMTADAAGGVWTYALDLARGLIAAGHRVRIAVLGPDPSPAQWGQVKAIRNLDVVTTGLPLDWTAAHEAELDRAAAELKRLALASQADLVHLNAPAHAGTGDWPLPVVAATHSCVATWWRALREEPLPPDLAWRAERTGTGMARADAILAPSRSLARALRETYERDLRIDVVHNGRESPPGLPEGPKDCILIAGRLWDRAKNVATVERAAGMMSTPVHAAGPLVAPHGERARLRNVAHLGNLSASELARWYRRTSIFVSLSRYEPFGLSVLEAAHAGAALVLSDIPTFRELWGGAARFVAPEDARGLARVLERLHSSPAERGALAISARQRALRYTLEQMLQGTLAVYARARRRHAQRSARRSAA
jgi:glycogen(starch) synthase